jgi:hypothetical protein
MQVLQRRWDPTFSEHSYGFRPGWSAHQAVAQAQTQFAAGYGRVIDLEKFFDRVNLYKLRAQLAKRVEGKRPLKIRAFSNAGARENGLVSPSVRSERAGHRVMKSITAIRHAKAQGKRDEERGGETTGAEVPSIQLYRRTKGQASNCAEGLGSFLSSESGRARPLRVLHKLRILTAASRARRMVGSDTSPGMPFR